MHFICHRNDIDEGQSKAFVVNDQAIFGVHHDTKLYFYLNRCPHLGVEMEWMENQFLDDSSAIIKCNVHGARFMSETGECISGPCQGDSLTRITTLETEQGIFWQTT